MKYSKLFRILGIGVILCLLMLVMPATPALAETGLEYIYLPTNMRSGEIGDEIDIYGYDFEPDEKVYIYFSGEEADVGDYMDDLDAYEEVTYDYTNGYGELEDSFDVPDELTDGQEEEDVHGGDYYVYATYTRDGHIVGKEEFTVIGIEIVPVEGYVGDEIEISGAGFEDEAAITVEYDGDEVDIVDGDEDTDEDGVFVCYIEVPESTAGDHTIQVTVYTDEAEAEFTVEPQITINPTSGSIDDEVTVNGTGFGYRNYVTIYFNNVEVVTSPSSPRTGTDGSFDATFNVPEVPAGTYDVDAEDTDDYSATAVFAISFDAAIDPTTGHVGTSISVTGTGFTAGGTVTIKYYLTAGATTGDTEDTTATVLTDGTFSATFDAPASAGGAHTVTVTDGINTKSFTFTMESTPPSTVYPQLPIMDGKLKNWKFDWCGDATDLSIEVTDASLPITYTLEIATDADFTNIVLTKPDLTTSEYTLTEEEEELLPSTKKEAPYYWRVKAIDAASNETAWTSPGTFYTGFQWTGFIGWPLYTVIGVGGVLLFLLGLWVGRRTVYY